MSNKKIITQYLDKLKQTLKDLKNFGDVSFEEFDKDIKTNWAIDRGLQLAIECSIDIGKEIITGLNLPKPHTYKETFQILARHDILDYELSRQMQTLADFRNRLVHAYLYIDQQEIFHTFKSSLDVLENYLLTIETKLMHQSKNFN